MKDPKPKEDLRARAEKERRREKRQVRPDQDSIAEGGFMLTTSEILDFSEGTDSTP